MRSTPRLASSVALSFVGHGLLVALGATWALGRLRVWDTAVESLQRQEAFIAELAFQAVEAEIAAAPPGEPVPAPAEEVPRGGAPGVPRPDQDRAGRGGEDAREPAQNLADQVDGLTRADAPRSRLDRSQHARLRSAKVRRARENWRATRQPMLLTTLSEGEREALEARFRRGVLHPSLGANGAGVARPEGGALGAAALEPGVGERPRDVGSDALGAQANAGAGSLGAAGERAGLERTDGRSRPASNEGTPSVPAWRDGKPADNVEAEQEVAALRSLLHASAAGGASGAGAGGSRGGGAPGAGGVSGEGSKSAALGDGKGAGYDPLTAARNLYVRGVLAKVQPLWSFPKWAVAEGLQGTVVVSFTVGKDGTLAVAPSVTRKSGIAEFDESCRKAVVSAAPFGPLPKELGASLAFVVPFTAKNPAVRPRDPADGGH